MILTWTQPAKYTDGSAFGSQNFAGYELAIDGKAAVAIPVQWTDSRNFSFDLLQLQLTLGKHTVQLRAVDKTGRKSAFSTPVPFEIGPLPMSPEDLTVLP
jgi:hypothetical protein